MKKELCYEENLNKVHTPMYDSSLIELLEAASIRFNALKLFLEEEL